jgi:omega-hydroxy-beta-dihydromenaquinone-9 sulfotransferase
MRLPNVFLRWRDAFFRSAGTNMLSGATLGQWLRLLRDNRYSVDARYWPRAVLTTLTAIPNSLTAAIEAWRFGRAIDQTKVPPPVFILGSWRSGTTHLHNLLARDERFAFPNQYQVTYPNTFLLTERSTAWFIDLCMPKRRPQDAVAMNVREPQEEDFAMCASGQVNLLAWSFPRNAEFYDRYMTMSCLSKEELSRWKASYLHFVKKLTYKYDQPLVLKSPANTGRIKTLLELFPNARFLNIHRHPYDVFRSNVHTLLTASPWWQLQRMNYGDENAIHARILCLMRTLFEAYFAQRSLIPAGRLHEIAYNDLERDPIGELRAAYKALDLPDFREVEPAVTTYLNSLTDYKKNTFAELIPDLRRRIYGEWRPCFDEWDYEP